MSLELRITPPARSRSERSDRSKEKEIWFSPIAASTSFGSSNSLFSSFNALVGMMAPILSFGPFSIL